MTEQAYICDAIRTPIGRYGGTLAAVRTDDLASIPIKAIIERNPAADWGTLDDVIYGCANQAGEEVQTQAHIRRIFSGTALGVMFDDPRHDSRTPDIIVEPEIGVIYTKPTNTTIVEHGGFSIEDTHVQTAQIAPTVLKLLGLNPKALEAVRIDKTQVLPGLF